MATPTVYVICDQNCKYEGMTKEQILTAIMQAVNDGTISNIDAGFISTVKTINGLTARYFIGTQAEYDNLSKEEKTNLFALITNDTTIESLQSALENMLNDLNELKEGLLSGNIVVGKAESANSATKDSVGNTIFSYYLAKKDAFVSRVNTVNEAWSMSAFVGKKRVGYLPTNKTVNDIIAVSLQITRNGFEENYYALKAEGKGTDSSGDYMEFVCFEASPPFNTSGFSVSSLTIRIYDIGDGYAYITRHNHIGMRLWTPDNTITSFTDWTETPYLVRVHIIYD